MVFTIIYVTLKGDKSKWGPVGELAAMLAAGSFRSLVFCCRFLVTVLNTGGLSACHIFVKTRPLQSKLQLYSSSRPQVMWRVVSSRCGLSRPRDTQWKRLMFPQLFSSDIVVGLFQKSCRIRKETHCCYITTKLSVCFSPNGWRGCVPNRSFNHFYG